MRELQIGHRPERGAARTGFLLLAVVAFGPIEQALTLSCQAARHSMSTLKKAEKCDCAEVVSTSGIDARRCDGAVYSRPPARLGGQLRKLRGFMWNGSGHYGLMKT
jgi:hypothetical protein